MSQATIPDLPFNGTPPDTVLFEISNSGVSESTDLSSIVFGLQQVSEKDQPNGYAGLDGSGLLDPNQIPDLSGTYQVITEKDVANGYAGLDATGLLLLGTIPQLPQSRTTDLETDLAARELLANKVTSVGTPGNDTNYPTEKATRDALDLKQDTLLFTPEDIANKVITVGTPGNDTNYPSEKAVRDALDLKEDSLGFTPEDIANKVITVGTPGNDTNYPSEKAVRDALDLKEDSLGFTPEDVANKATDLLTPDNTEYPTTLAVTTFALQYQLLNEKGAVSGYAGLDASQELLLANFPSGSALQVLRRNAGNNALEFATVAAGGAQTPWTSDIDGAGFALLDSNYIEVGSSLATPFADAGTIRMPDQATIEVRQGGDTANNIILFDDAEISFEGWNSFAWLTAATTFDLGNADLGGIENFEMNGAGEMDLAESVLRSPSIIVFSATDQEQAISLGNVEVISWQKLAGTGYAGISSNASNQFVIGFSAASPGALVAEYAFTEIAADFLGNTLTNVAIYESNATFPSTAGAIRLGDLESIGFRNSTNDDNYTIVSDDPTLTFNLWETIEFPDATIIDAGQADLQILSIDMSGDIVVNGFSILQPGLIESNAGTPADAGFLRMGNTELLAWRDFGDTGNITLSVNASDQFAFNSVLTVGNNVIKAVDTPVDGTDAANKTYVDNLVNGLVWKDAADIATTGDITLSGEQTIDGVLTSTSRVLVKDQASGQFNGVYDTAAGAWTRTTDTDTDVELNNMSIFISNGTVNAGSSWTQTTDLPITVDTTVLVYAQIGAGSINPLTTKGDIFGYDTGSNRIPVGTDGQTLIANSAVALGVEWQTIGSPLIAKGDLYTFTTLDARLPVGITGQILSANAGETTGLEWIDNELSPLTSKGDIYTFTTVNERIAVGTNGQVLSANSAQPTGLEWITLPPPGGSQTPWTSDIDAATFDLSDFGVLSFDTPATSDPGQSNSISMQTGTFTNDMHLHVDSGTGEFHFFIGASATSDFRINNNSVTMDFKSLNGLSGIRGNNDLKILDLITLASTVNNLQLTAGTAGNGPLIESEGSDTNVDIRLSPKGFADGSVHIQSRALKMDEINTPTAPPANDAKIYPKNVGGRSHLFIQDDVGEVDLQDQAVPIINSISQLDSSLTVTDTGTDGLFDFIADSLSVLQINSVSTNMKHRFETRKATTISNISSSVATLNNEGNLFDFNNTVATFNSIASTGWQAGSVIYLQFTSADATGVELIHDFAASNPQEPFWLLNETNYTVNNTNSNQILSFIYDGTYWVQQAFGEISGGDVVGPGSATDNAIARFDLTTGKLIQNSGVTIDDNNTTSHPGPIVLTAQGTVPAGTETYFREVANDLIINVASAQAVDFNFGTTTRVTFTTSGIDLLTNTLAQAVVDSTSILNGTQVQTAALSYANGLKQVFNPSSANAGLNVGAQADPDPSAPVNGDIYYNSTNNKFRIYENSLWIDMVGAGTGDVVGPASAVNHNIAVFDGATGKLIDGAGSSGFEIIVDTAGQPTLPRNLIFTSFAVAPPSGTTGYIGNYSNEMVINGNLAVEMHIQNVQTLRLSSTDLLLNDLNVLLGTGYAEFEEITTPSLPAADKGRLYVKDVSTETHLFFINSSGEDTDLTVHNVQTPWESDIDAAGFDLGFKTTNPITIGQGATDLLSITYLDDVADAGIRIGNTDGFVSITNESAVAGDNQSKFLMSSGGATTIQNVMEFEINTADDSGTIPALKLNFQDDVGGGLTRPFFSIDSGATEYLRVQPNAHWLFNIATQFDDMGKINFANATTTDAADRVIKLDEADRITWDGAAASTPNSILFTTGDIFQVFINNALQFQITATSANFLNGLIQGVSGYEFQVGTSDIVGTSTDLELNGPTNVAIHISDVAKFSFDTSFLNMNNLHIRHLNSIRGDLSGTPIILKVEEVGSAVNYLQIVNAVSAEGPTLSANGTATNIDLNFETKGTGFVTFVDAAKANSNVQLKYGGTVASAANMSSFQGGNFYDVTGSATINFLVDDLFFQAGHFITFQFNGAATLTHNAASPPTNFAIMLLKGDVDFVATAGDIITLVFNGLEWEEVSRNSQTTPGLVMIADIDLNANSITNVHNIVHDQSAITYNATLAFDFDADQEQTLAVTGDLTTLTTSNRAAGKSKSIFITGDTVNRTLTFNASWRTNPSTATVTITANTFGLLTFGCKGGAETDVFCAYAEFV